MVFLVRLRLFALVVWICAAASLYVGSGLQELDFVSDGGLYRPVVMKAAVSEVSLVHLRWEVVVLMDGHPPRMHLVAGTYRSLH